MYESLALQRVDLSNFRINALTVMLFIFKLLKWPFFIILLIKIIQAIVMHALLSFQNPINSELFGSLINVFSLIVAIVALWRSHQSGKQTDTTLNASKKALENVVAILQTEKLALEKQVDISDKTHKALVEQLKINTKQQEDSIREQNKKARFSVNLSLESTTAIEVDLDYMIETGVAKGAKKIDENIVSDVLLNSNSNTIVVPREKILPQIKERYWGTMPTSCLPDTKHIPTGYSYESKDYYLISTKSKWINMMFTLSNIGDLDANHVMVRITSLSSHVTPTLKSYPFEKIFRKEFTDKTISFNHDLVSDQFDQTSSFNLEIQIIGDRVETLSLPVTISIT